MTKEEIISQVKWWKREASRRERVHAKNNDSDMAWMCQGRVIAYGACLRCLRLLQSPKPKSKKGKRT